MRDPMAKDLQTSRTHLIEAGFRPARLAGPVRLLRRLIWPIVRPFHFHTLEQLAKAEAAIERLQAEVQRLADLKANVAGVTALEVRMDRAEARADAAAGDLLRLDNAQQSDPATARLEAVEAGLFALRDARRPAREQEVARLDKIEGRLDRIENWADAHRRRTDGLQQDRAGDVSQMKAANARLRSDVLAVGNRHVWVEERVTAALEATQLLRQEILPRLDNLEGRDEQQEPRSS